MKRIIITIASIGLISLISLSEIYAGSHGHNMTSNWTCSQKVSGGVFMGQMPLHLMFNMHCIETGEINGDKFNSASHCVGNQVIGMDGKGSFSGTCRSYHKAGGTLFVRFTDFGSPMDQSGEGDVVVMGGEGKFKGASGMGTFTWTQGPMDPQDQTTSAAFGETKIKLTIP
tara:strand:+ start:240 stop:752 length:513 start_codon:yes stop_codon:yes gene_type:complete